MLTTTPLLLLLVREQDGQPTVTHDGNQTTLPPYATPGDLWIVANDGGKLLPMRPVAGLVAEALADARGSEALGKSLSRDPDAIVALVEQACGARLELLPILQETLANLGGDRCADSWTAKRKGPSMLSLPPHKEGIWRAFLAPSRDSVILLRDRRGPIVSHNGVLEIPGLDLIDPDGHWESLEFFPTSREGEYIARKPRRGQEPPQ